MRLTHRVGRPLAFALTLFAACTDRGTAMHNNTIGNSGDAAHESPSTETTTARASRDLVSPAPAQAGVSGATSGPAGRGGVVRLRKAQMVDQQIFGQPTEVLRLLIPADWTFQAGYTVNLAVFRWCPENAFMPSLQAESADRRLGFAAYPSLTTLYFRHPILAEDARRRRQMGQDFCLERPPMTMPQFVEQMLIPGFRVGARMLRVEPVPDLERRVRGQIASTPQSPTARSSGEAADVVIGYEVNGQPVEEHIFIVGGWRAESAGVGGDGQGDMISSSYTPLFGVRVPRGEFAAHQQQFADLSASIQPNLRFFAAITETIATQRANIFRGFTNEIRRTSDIWRASWEASNNAAKQADAAKAQSTRHDVVAAWSDTILDVQNYRDANGDTVQLSGGYNHAFSNGNGEYIQTNDPSYNPAVDAGSRWESIAAIPR